MAPIGALEEVGRTFAAAVLALYAQQGIFPDIDHPIIEASLRRFLSHGLNEISRLDEWRSQLIEAIAEQLQPAVFTALRLEYPRPG